MNNKKKLKIKINRKEEENDTLRNAMGRNFNLLKHMEALWGNALIVEG